MEPENRFCPGCGAPAGAEPTAGAPVPAVGAPFPAGETLLSQRTSPLFLAALICRSVTMALSLFYLFFLLVALGMASGYIDDRYLSRWEAEMLSGLGVVLVLCVLGTVAIAGVILTGLWMVYASGRSVGREAALVQGLKLVRGGLLAQMIYMFVGLVIAAGVGLLMAFGGGAVALFSTGDSYDHNMTVAVGGVLLIVGLVVLLVTVAEGALMAIFYVKARRAVGYALDAAQTGRLTGVPALYLVVMCFALAGFTLLSLGWVGGTGGVLAVVAALVTVADSVLFGALALRCRNLAAPAV